MTIVESTPAVTVLQALRSEGGTDPAPYFEIVADTLLVQYGREALGLADAAIDRMNGLCDDEGGELWHEVKAVLVRRIACMGRASQPFLH